MNHSNLIPREFIHDLLTRIDIVELIDASVPLKKAGRNYQACCPFHAEKSPSFTVSPTKQFYHCFGCGASGNALSFLINYQHIDFVSAVETLAQQLGLTVPREAKAQAAQQIANDNYSVLQQAKQFYQRQLKHSPKAIQYLQQRGLTGEIAKRYRIGYAPAQWDALLTHISQPALLSATGLVIEKEQGQGYYDRFRDRIMFPIHDRRGRVIGFGGRVLDNSLPKYMNSPETSLFHKSHVLYGLYEARQANNELAQIIVVEGYMDVVALAQAGITHAVATLGTATTAQHLSQLFQLTRQIIFCFDGDRAGFTAAWRALETALPLIQDDDDIRFLFLPEGEDPDTMVRKESTDAFLQRTQQALSLGDFLFQRLRQDLPLTTIENRARFTQEVLSLLEIITAPILREFLLDRLAETVRIEKTRLPQFISTIAAKQTNTVKIQRTPMRLAIALLLQYPTLIQQLPKDIDITLFKLPGGELLQALYQMLQENPALTTASLLEIWRDQPEANLLHKLAAWELNIPENGIVAEWQGVLHHLQHENYQFEIELLLQKANVNALSDEEKKRLHFLLAKKK